MKLYFTVNMFFVVNIQNYLMCTLHIGKIIIYTYTHLDNMCMLISAKKKIGTFIYFEDIDSSSNLFLVEEPLKIFFISRGNPSHENEYKTKRRLVLQGDYSNIDNFRTKIPAIFRDNLVFVSRNFKIF